MCPAEPPAWVFIGPSEQRFPASFEAVSMRFLWRLSQPVISWTRPTSCPQSKVILLTQSRQLVMTTLSVLDLLGQFFFSFLTWFWYLILHIAVLPLCLLFHWFLRGVSSAVCFLLYSLRCLQAVFEITHFWIKIQTCYLFFFWWPDKNVSKIQFSHLSLNSPWCDKMINVASRRALAQPMTPLTHQSSCTSIHHLCDMVLPPPPR